MSARSSSASSLAAFWAVVGVLTVYVLFRSWETPILVLAIGFVLGTCALLPVYLWCAKKAPGMPIYPMMALTYVWTFALPLLTQHSAVEKYSTAAQVHVGLTAILFLCVSTLVWWRVIRQPASAPPVVLALPAAVAVRLLLLGLGGACLVQMAVQGRWLPLPSGVNSIIMAANNAVTTLAVIVLANRLGQRQLSAKEKTTFFSLFLVFLFISLTSLVMVAAMSLIFVALVAFTLGRGKPPLPVAVLALALFFFLHAGKSSIRELYWKKNQDIIQPLNYPSLYLSWFGYSFEALAKMLQTEEAQGQTLAERSSLIHMLLLVQSKTPQEIPYFAGQTYLVIPEMFVPRFLNPDKLRSHEGTYILAIAYGLQMERDTKTTTIGFGLLAEAYANFGYGGVIALAILLGCGSGLATRWGLNVPLVSLRGLTGLLALAAAVQTEFTAGVLVTSLFQSGVVLLVASLLLMQPLPNLSLPRLALRVSP